MDAKIQSAVELIQKLPEAQQDVLFNGLGACIETDAIELPKWLDKFRKKPAVRVSHKPKMETTTLGEISQ